MLREDQLPPLTGYNQAQALKIRKAYLRYLDTNGYENQAVSRLDIGIHINLIEVQMRRIFIIQEKYDLEDMVYDEYLEKRGNNWYIKPEAGAYGYYLISMFLKTKDWLPITNRVQCFELLIRCIMYDFKTSDKFKNYVKNMFYRPRFYDHCTVF